MTGTAIILVGGTGSRLGKLTAQTPKPLLPVAGKPFLFYLFDRLIANGVTDLVLATGYLATEFSQRIGDRYGTASVRYSYEPSPLGTGGAIALALESAHSPNVLVLNGDTYFPIGLSQLSQVHTGTNATLTMALRHVPDVARYGNVILDRSTVTAIREKNDHGPGLINAGLYLINAARFASLAPRGPFSLERDLLAKLIARQQVSGVSSDAYFIDIGIPEDFARANTDFAAGGPLSP